jgi:hypothetical protein
LFQLHLDKDIECLTQIWGKLSTFELIVMDYVVISETRMYYTRFGDAHRDLIKYHYDELGRKTQETITTLSLDVFKQVSYIWIYDEQNKTVKVEVYHDNDLDHYIFYEENHEPIGFSGVKWTEDEIRVYTKNPNEIDIKRKYYNLNNNVVQIQYLTKNTEDSSCMYNHTSHFKYDEYNRIIEENSYAHTSNEVYHTHTDCYVFGSFDRLIKKTTVQVMSDLDATYSFEKPAPVELGFIEYIYDDKGKLIREIHNKNNKVDYTRDYYYIDDKMGNWTVQSEVVRNKLADEQHFSKEPLVTIIRELEYPKREHKDSRRIDKKSWDIKTYNPKYLDESQNHDSL